MFIFGKCNHHDVCLKLPLTQIISVNGIDDTSAATSAIYPRTATCVNKVS